MGISTDSRSLPPPSALQTFLKAHPLSPNSSHTSDLHHLALQIAHNLQYMHLWTDVCLHTHSSINSAPLPRPLLSGVPPNRLYVHPDEQIELLQKQKDEGKTGLPHLEPQREWVLPSHLREKWSLKRFGETFDAIRVLPLAEQGEALFPALHQTKSGEEDTSTWRKDMPKRVLLATLDDDSTIVYYIVHDGIVKPRQN